MAKKIKAEDGKVYVEKKPFYKRAWFIVLAAVVLIGVFANMGGDSDSKDTSASSSAKSESTSAVSSTKESSQDKGKTYKVGDVITFKDEAEITITGAEWSDERNEFADTNPEKVLKVTYNVNNLSDDDYVLGDDLELYVNGKKMDTYPNGGTLDSISKGRSFEGAVQYFGVNGSGDIEVEVEPSFSFTAEPAVVKLDIQ
ncbi:MULTISPECIES: immunity protein [Streptococcus]|uniref:Immunity protein n=1 Tax=Streptococcus vicugnae TaxID=2740579 RepID=A0A4R5G418_9STRE|nr:MULTISPECIES: immunity protein [Streptococcus]MBJ7540741.1 immunity protein [Streptococcus vicugnae]TDE72063.1 immunity protein [Streptococcus vicugnae]